MSLHDRSVWIDYAGILVYMTCTSLFLGYNVCSFVLERNVIEASCTADSWRKKEMDHNKVGMIKEQLQTIKV